MDSGIPDLEFQSSADEKQWNMEGQLGQPATGGAPTLDVNDENDGMHTFTNFPDSAVDGENEAESDSTGLIKRDKPPVWTFAYYQEYFDVDTKTVLQRLKGSVLPLPNQGFSRTYIKAKPDMYGPFWICTTLVLSLGVCGNLSTLVNNIHEPNYKYTAQFELLPIAAVIIYSYTFLLPLILKGFLVWRKASDFPISQIICTYGYSMFVFVPASMLFIVPSVTFDWIVVAVAVLLSGSVILISLWPAFENDSKKVAFIVLALLFLLHGVVVVCVRLYFFSPVPLIPKVNSTTTPVVTTGTSSTG